MPQRTVIVTDGDQRAALAVVRSLGAAGFRCVVATPVPRSIAGASRYAAREQVVPDALRAPAEYVDAVLALADGEHAALLVPIAEGALLALLPERTRFGSCAIPFPSIASFRALSDKQRVLGEAAALGIAVPSQVVVPDADAGRALAAASVTFPVVLKPARSVGVASGERVKVGVAHAANTRELQQAIARLSPAAFPLLLQQRIDGPGIGVFLLVWDGAVRAAFAHRRLAEKPPWGGVSVHSESIPLDANLVERSRALLGRFDWHGVAMVEYKRDATTGIEYLMEINGRFWGSLQLAIDAGVDFPRLLAAHALEDPVPVAAPYVAGVRSRWSWGLVDHLVARARPRGNPIPAGIRGVWRVLGDLLFGALGRRSRESVLRWSDPRPFWRETLAWFARL